MSVASVINALRTAGISVTGREIAEAIWLARYLEVSTEPAPEASGEPSTSQKDGLTTPNAASPPAASPETVPLGVTTPSGTHTPVRGHPVRVPDLPGIRRRQSIVRALRPLRLQRPSSRYHVIDETATASFIASTGTWSPILRPARERWFDVVLVVDASPSMTLWRPLVNDLQKVLTQTGAFRDVRTLQLTPQKRGSAVWHNSVPAARSPRELIDVAGRRLFFMVTDGAAHAWHDGAAAIALAEWARTGPAAILQPLPEEMWSRTGLAPVPARLSSHAIGAPNSRLRVTYHRRRRVNGTPIPVLGIEPTALHSWARLIAGPIFAVPLATMPTAGGKDSFPPLSAANDDTGALDRFRASASPQAYQLAIWLSVVPLTLPIMRLVQHVATPASASALAEVVLGGLVYRISNDTYEFRPGIREQLITQLRRSEVATVLSAVSHHIAQQPGTTNGTFPAIAVRTDGPVTAAAEEFSWVPPTIAARLGLPVAAQRNPTDAGPDQNGVPSNDQRDLQTTGGDPSSGHDQPHLADPSPMDRSRVAEVVVRSANGGHLYGTGYRVTQNMVLTVAHLVKTAERIEVRFYSTSQRKWTAQAAKIWADDASDLAVLQFDPPPDMPSVTPTRYARLGPHGDAVKVAIYGLHRTTPHPDANVPADRVELFGTLNPLPGGQSVGIEFAVRPLGVPDFDASPLQGMSGAPVWWNDHLIGLISSHNRTARRPRFTATRIDQTLAGELSLRLANLLGISDVREIATMSTETTPQAVRSAYRDESVSELAPTELIGRAGELEELAAFCFGAQSYTWWQGPPATGKTALMATFALNPPANVEILSHFVSGRQAPRADSSTFTEAMLHQLSAILGNTPPTSLTPAEKVAHLRAMLDAAADKVGTEGRRLVLVVDGLDEDPGMMPGSGLASIASLLPKVPHKNLRIVVSSRDKVTLPPDVSRNHPLRHCQVRILATPNVQSQAPTTPAKPAVSAGGSTPTFDIDEVISGSQQAPASLQHFDYHEPGAIARDRGDLDAAEAKYHQALAIHQELGNRAGAADSYHQLGAIARDRGDLDSAEAKYHQALAIHQELGNRAGAADSYHQLGAIARDRGDLDSAEAKYHQALAIHQELGNRAGAADSYHQLGAIAQSRGRLEDWHYRSSATRDQDSDRQDEELRGGEDRGDVLDFSDIPEPPAPNPHYTVPGLPTEPTQFPPPQPRPASAGSIHGIGVTVLVTDLQRSLRFYHDMLGFYQIDSGPDSAVIASGDTRLILMQAPESTPVHRRLVHLNLEVLDVHAVYRELKNRGIRFTTGPRVVNRGKHLQLVAASFKDPDGHGIAIIQWKPSTD